MPIQFKNIILATLYPKECLANMHMCRFIKLYTIVFNIAIHVAERRQAVSRLEGVFMKG